MAGMLRVPRTRGALSGLLLVLLGVWGGLVAFVGPYFDYAYTPDRAWAFDSGRFWLSVLPGAVTVLGGLIVLLSANRAVAVLGAWLAALSGAWFVVGATISTLWTADGRSAAGEPVGGETARAFEQIGFFTGVGIAIVFFAALALGRFTVVGAKDVALAERQAAEAEALREARTERKETERKETERVEGERKVPDRTEELPAAPVPAAAKDPEPATTYPKSTYRENPRTHEATRVEENDRPRATT